MQDWRTDSEVIVAYTFKSSEVSDYRSRGSKFKSTCYRFETFVHPTLHVFRKRYQNQLVPSTWCLCRGEDPTQGGICNLSWSHKVVVSISNPKRLELFPGRPPEKRRAGSVYNSNAIANSLYRRLERNKSAYSLHKCCVCACYINLFSVCTFGLLIIINM